MSKTMATRGREGLNRSSLNRPKVAIFIGGNMNVVELRSRLLYRPETGKFFWIKTTKYHPEILGTEAGTIRIYKHNNKKYRWVKIDSHAYPAHRLAWFYFYGEWPKGMIDHKDGNSLNNKIVNLNDATSFMNTQNHKVIIKKSGLPTGVRMLGKKFQARIRFNNIKKHLGIHDTAEKALNAYTEARKKFHYCPNSKGGVMC